MQFKEGAVFMRKKILEKYLKKYTKKGWGFEKQLNSWINYGLSKGSNTIISGWQRRGEIPRLLLNSVNKGGEYVNGVWNGAKNMAKKYRSNKPTSNSPSKQENLPMVCNKQKAEVQIYREPRGDLVKVRKKKSGKTNYSNQQNNTNGFFTNDRASQIRNSIKGKAKRLLKSRGVKALVHTSPAALAFLVKKISNHMLRQAAQMVLGQLMSLMSNMLYLSYVGLITVLDKWFPGISSLGSSIQNLGGWILEQLPKPLQDFITAENPDARRKDIAEGTLAYIEKMHTAGEDLCNQFVGQLTSVPLDEYGLGLQNENDPSYIARGYHEILQNSQHAAWEIVETWNAEEEECWNERGPIHHLLGQNAREVLGDTLGCTGRFLGNQLSAMILYGGFKQIASRLFGRFTALQRLYDMYNSAIELFDNPDWLVRSALPDSARTLWYGATAIENLEGTLQGILVEGIGMVIDGIEDLTNIDMEELGNNINAVIQGMLEAISEEIGDLSTAVLEEASEQVDKLMESMGEFLDDARKEFEKIAEWINTGVNMVKGAAGISISTYIAAYYYEEKAAPRYFYNAYNDLLSRCEENYQSGKEERLNRLSAITPDSSSDFYAYQHLAYERATYELNEMAYSNHDFCERFITERKGYYASKFGLVDSYTDGVVTGLKLCKASMSATIIYSLGLLSGGYAIAVGLGVAILYPFLQPVTKHVARNKGKYLGLLAFGAIATVSYAAYSVFGRDTSVIEEIIDS